MKVLLLFPMADGQTGPAIKYAFEQLGHAVVFVDAKICPEDSYRAACEFKPDLVFCSRTKELTNEVMKIKSELGNSIIVCMWNVDTRTDINEWGHLFSLIRSCDYHFVSAWGTLPKWRKINKNTFWLSQGLQNEVYNKPKKITNEDRKKYSCDVCWAGDRSGMYHKFRDPFLTVVEQMGINFKQWGCGGKPKIYNEEHNKMVALSKINLACSAFPENERCVSVRDYKILGAGGFLLEYYRKGLYRIFPLGFCDHYDTPDQLVRIIGYYLEHEEKRTKMAKRGYEWVHENATYTHRVKMALDYMKERLE